MVNRSDGRRRQALRKDGKEMERETKIMKIVKGKREQAVKK